jgi:hypothetical protein
MANTTSNWAFAVFTSVLAVTSCNFYSSDNVFHQICGLLGTQEFERFGAFFCAVFDEDELYAQIYENSVAITTRVKPKESKPGESNCMFFAQLTLNEICASLTQRPAALPSKWDDRPLLVLLSR